MNIFNRVTIQSLKKNKTRTIVTIIGIILSAAMITAVTTFASSFQNFLLKNAVYNKGNWHGSALSIEWRTYAELFATGKIEDAVYNQQLGYSYLENCKNKYKPYLFIIGAGEDFEKNMPVHIVNGRYPENDSEILLPLHLSEDGGILYHLGDTLSLDIGSRFLEGEPLGQHNPAFVYTEGSAELTNEIFKLKEKRNYTVVGFYERPSFEPLSAPGYTAITIRDKNTSSHYFYDAYLKLKNPDDTYSFMKEMELSGTTNTDVLMYSGSFGFDGFDAALSSFVAIIISLIIFGSVSLIYNAFSISVSERTKLFGLLSSIGATKRQLRRMVFFEALTVSTIGIPIGIITGIGGIGITLLFVGERFAGLANFPLPMKTKVSFISIVVAAVIALITVLISAYIPSKRATKVSAVEAIRQSSDIKETKKPIKTSKITYKLFGLSGVLASKHYKRNKKRYRSTVVSLFMSIVLFVSASAFTDYLTLSATRGFSDNGYDLHLFCDESDFKNISKNELLAILSSKESVRDGAYVQRIPFRCDIDKKYLSKEYIALEQDSVYSVVMFIDDMSFKELLKTYKLSEEEFLDPDKPLAVSLDGNFVFDSEKGRYVNISVLSADTFETDVSVEKTIEGYYLSNEYENEKGEIICKFLKDGTKDEIIELPQSEVVRKVPLYSGKTIYEKLFYVEQNNIGVVMIYPESLKTKVLPDYNFSRCSYQFFFTSDNHSLSYKEMEKELVSFGLSGNTFQDYAADMETSRNIIFIIRVFSYGFIVLISLIAAANVFNTITTNIALRRREFAMLKSVGMTKKGFNKMMAFECLLYGSRALIFGIPVSIAITFLIYLAAMNALEINFHLPIFAIGISMLSVFAVVFSTMIYAMRKIKKDNPIDALKNENI